MKIKFIISAVLVVLCIVGCQRKKVSPNEPGKLVYTETDIDMGTVYIEDGKVAITYHIKNDGGKAFYIKDVASTCDCTNTEYERRFLKSGEKSDINATLDLSKFEEGPYERMIYVYSSLKQRPDTLYLHGVAKHKKK